MSSSSRKRPSNKKDGDEGGEERKEGEENASSSSVEVISNRTNPYLCYTSAAILLNSERPADAKKLLKESKELWQYTNINGGCHGLLWKISLNLEPNNTEKHQRLCHVARSHGYHDAIAAHEMRSFLEEKGRPNKKQK